jgi:hypothetical protein
VPFDAPTPVVDDEVCAERRQLSVRIELLTEPHELRPYDGLLAEEAPARLIYVRL